MKKQIKAVIFDAGGVITEWKKPLTSFFMEINVTVERWIKAVEPDEEAANKGLLSPDNYFQRILRRLDRESHAVRLKEVFPGSFERIEETFTLLEELKPKFRLVLLTNAILGSVDQLDKTVGHKKYFEIIIDSSVVGMVKPEKEIFILTCNKLGLSSKECLFVDDTKEYIEAAKKLGFQTVHFTDPKKGVTAIRKVLGLR